MLYSAEISALDIINTMNSSSLLTMPVLIALKKQENNKHPFNYQITDLNRF